VHVAINYKVIFFMCTPSLSPLNVVLLVIMMAVTCMNIRGDDDHRLIGSTWFPVDFDTTIDIFFIMCSLFITSLGCFMGRVSAFHIDCVAIYTVLNEFANNIKGFFLIFQFNEMGEC
jgi:uncharacterized membrane protein